MIDCRACGYADLAQAVIYLTSHDVEGPGNERLFNYPAMESGSRLRKASQARLRMPAHGGGCRRPPRRPGRKKVLAWRRGIAGSDEIVVVVANFSAFTTPAGPSASYTVP